MITKHGVKVHVDTLSSKGIVGSVEESFDTSYIDANMVAFVEKFIKESPFYYVSVLDFSTKQGAIPTCERSMLTQFHDVSDCEVKCYDERWSFFTSQADLYEIEKLYKDIGVDFIFSPFSVLTHFFQEKIKERMAMFVLIQETSVTLCIFEESQLLYGEYLDMQSDFDDNEELVLESGDEDEDISFDMDLEESIDLEDVDVIDDMDDIDDIEDFGDIEDLDSVEDIDEFSEDIEEEFYQESEEEIEQHTTSDSFNEDYQRFSLIQTSLNKFYKDTRYESKFVEYVYVADGVGISPDLKRYLEEEMFLTVYVRQADLGAEVSTLAQVEVGL